ncbi:hypothetical protein MPSEU_001077000 [Mayamaea pseudoterrestris]|nr:hypothetical protein MPSEU_001077000 [Mayamaea pseudoterrestris]
MKQDYSHFQLTEWQRFDVKTREIRLHRASLLDILAATDAPWGHVASLSKRELAEHLERQECERMERQMKRASDKKQQQHGRTRRDRHEKFHEKLKEAVNANAFNHPFPLGPAPILKRTNPETNRRQVVTGFKSMDGTTKSTEYTFAPESTPRLFHDASPPVTLRDASYAQVMLRLHPLMFLALYEHEKKHGRVGVCAHSRRTTRRHYKQSMSMSDCNNNNQLHRIHASNDSVCLGGVVISSRALLCALARSYALGLYAQLSMEQILCFQPYCVCSSSNNARDQGSGNQCTRHYILMDYKEIEERTKEAKKKISHDDLQPTPSIGTTITNELEWTASPSSSDNNKSPDTLNTMSTITTSASSEIVCQQRKDTPETDDDEAARALLQLDQDKPLANYQTHRQRLVDSSSSHALQAPPRRIDHATATTPYSDSGGSHSHHSMASRPKSFWPNTTTTTTTTTTTSATAASRLHPPVKQLDDARSLLEPLPLRAVSSDSLEVMVKVQQSVVSKSGAAAGNQQQYASSRRTCSGTPAMGYSSSMALGMGASWKNKSNDALCKSIKKNAQATGPAMTMQLQWNCSSTTLPVSNLLGRRHDFERHFNQQANTCNDAQAKDCVAHTDEAVAALPAVKDGVTRRETNDSSFLMSDCDELDSATASDIDSQATQASGNLVIDTGLNDSTNTRFTFDDLWDDDEMPPPTSPPRATRSGGTSTVKSGSSGLDSVATQCSSPVSVTTIALNEGVETIR